MARKHRNKAQTAAGSQTKVPPSFDGEHTIGRGFEQTRRRETTGAFQHEPDRVAPGEGTLGAGSTYAVGEELGRGGMGSVSKARQSALHRDVAVKRLKASRASDPEMRQSFVAEALITGMLDHPNIVPVHDLLQTESGIPALAMKAVGGHSWLQVLHPTGGDMHLLAQATTREDHLQTLITVCNAVAFAHSKGILHRDLKPSNVMLGEFGEVLLMDWGMALVFESHDDHPDALAPLYKTNVVKPAGSPGYMAPEMALGRGDLFGPWTDVYLLGAVLHEILTGSMPHEGDTVTKVLKAACASEPVEFGPDVPEELAGICRKAMARKMAHRYQSARELQKALKGYLLHVQSHRLVVAAEEILATVDQEWDGQSALTPARRTVVYQALDEANAMWKQARVLWDGNPDAHDGELRTRLLHGRLAFSCEDYGVAQAHLTGLEDEEALEIRRNVVAAMAEREKAERTTTLIRRGAVVGTILMLVGFAVGFVIVSLEKGRADQNARDATQLAQKAQRNLERAEEGERQASLNAKRAQDSAARVENEARARIAALEAGAKQRARADTQEARADSKTREALENARLAEEKGREAEERAREAEAALAKAQLAEAEAREAVRAAELANLEKEQALEEGRRLADAQIASRVLVKGEALLASQSTDPEPIGAWLHTASQLVERQRLHEDGLISIQLDASARIPSRSRDLRKLQSLLDERDELTATGDDARRLERVLELITKYREKTRRPSSPYDFPGEDERWHYGVLLELVTSLEKLADPGHGLLARVRRQRDLAVAGGAADRYSRRWTSAIQGVLRSRHYKGLQLTPQPGLVPVGKDPRSGLYEFVHLQSHAGPLPVRNAKGELVLRPDTGVILVLIPGGSFTMGAQSKKPRDPGYEAGARPQEGPVHDVPLDPYLLSKYELTQGQWQRVMGHNPSFCPPTARYGGRDHTLLHPVENVTWDDLRGLESACGLALPTEAQWEHGARGGKKRLPPLSEAHSNLADRSHAQGAAEPRAEHTESWDDTFPMHAPVGCFPANGYGLHDVQGNVREWCRDGGSSYSDEPRPGDGARASRGSERGVRGGSFVDVAADASPSRRRTVDRDKRHRATGLRPVFPLMTQPVNVVTVTWKDVGTAIAKDKQYAGLELKARKDLAPLGPDPESGFHEFLHLPSHDGPHPVRDARGRLAITGATGLVFVLVPGGTFFLGAQRGDPIEKNFDPSARKEEGPVHEVTLKPFFVSKYEMTQGQWLRLVGDNPSRITRDDNLRLPVESVTWDACAALAGRGLAIPTEAQWEYAARAGNGGPWPVSEEDLATVANLGDQSLKRKFKSRRVSDWDDGFPFHAPVGSFRPNAFGLFDTIGNVAEWCLDWEAAYTNPVAPDTGERKSGGGRNRIFRGGSYLIMPGLARHGCRAGRRVDFTNSYLGWRPILAP